MDLRESTHITFKNILDTPYTEELREWRNQDFVRENMTNHDLIGEEEHRAYLDSLRRSDTNKVFLAMNHADPLAVVTMKINWEEQYVEPGTYIINQKYLGNGYGIIMSYFRLEYIFDLMPSGRMRTVILDKNERNISLQKKMGCEQESHFMVEDKNGNQEPAAAYSIKKDRWDIEKISIAKRIDEKFGMENIERFPLDNR